ncbi:MAG: class I SAM-dependent methyltransferase [Xanthomonadales bacterium]|nr:class I SAM-dependent methyltransferase [Xanthomonadales bacterium]
MSKQHWSEYWKTGALTSLPADFKENYDGELYEYWKTVLLSGLPQLKILDVCTGNGAVALLLSEIAEKHHIAVDVVAVDASDIKPSRLLNAFPQKKVHINQINFIGNCFVESMATTVPGTFDLIVSQYGIEYCDTEQAATNIVQKLKACGRLVFIAHSPNTAMLEYMEIEQQIFNYLDTLKAFDLLLNFSRNKISTNHFKNNLQQCLQAMSEQHHFKSQNLFNTWGKMMYQMLQIRNADLKNQRVKVGQFAKSHLFAKARAQDMLDVSQKLMNDTEWYQPFIAAGLSLENHGEMTYQGKHNVGHFYEFVKNQT